MLTWKQVEGSSHQWKSTLGTFILSFNTSISEM